mgnify:FL=1
MKPGDLFLVKHNLASFYLDSDENIYKNDIGIVLEAIHPLMLCLIQNKMVLLYPEEFEIISSI